MDGQQTRPLVYAGSYTACCEGEAPGEGSPQSHKKAKLPQVQISLKALMLSNQLNLRIKDTWH